jgi:hypothetical protein
VQGADTSWQNLLRAPTGFTSDILAPEVHAAIQFIAVADSADLVRKIQMVVRRDSLRSQTAAFSLVGDSVVGGVSSLGRSQAQRYGAPPNALIFQYNFVAFLDQVLRRAAHLRGANREVPVYLYGTPGALDTARVRSVPNSDSVVIGFGSAEYRLKVDPLGRIAGGKMGSMEFHRISFRNFLPGPPPAGCPPPGTPTESQLIKTDAGFRKLASVFGLSSSDIDSIHLVDPSADAEACSDLLDLFPPKSGPTRIYQAGSIYIVVTGPETIRRAAFIVGDHRSIITPMVISTGAPPPA